MMPHWTNFAATTSVPHRDFFSFIFNSFHIESNGGDRVDHFTELELVEYHCCARGIESSYKYRDFLLFLPVGQGW